MAEESFPIVDKPMSAAQWAEVTRGIGNGILDQGGFPYRLIFKSDANITNRGFLRCPTIEGKKWGAAILGGFLHKYTADLPLDFPAVTRATTYYVVLELVPTRATEGGLPVQAKVVTALDYAQGRNYLTLWTVRREPNQLLTEATVQMVRPRVAPVQVYAYEEHMPPASTALWGTLAVAHNGRANDSAVLKMAMTGDDAESVDGWYWKTVYDPNANAFEWTDIPDTSTYVNPGSGFTRALGRRGRERKLRGRVALRSGNAFDPGGNYNILSGPIDESDAPAATERFVCAVSGSLGPGPRFANVEISSSGEVTANTSAAVTFIDLASCRWEAKS